MPTRISNAITLAVAAAALFATPAAAQSSASHRLIVEGGAGYAEFVDNAPIRRVTFSGGARWFLSPRVAIGPEVVYMIGPDIDRDWVVTGNLTLDLRSPGATPHVVTPYIIGGGGWTQMTRAVGTGPYTSSEGTFTAGAGVRISPNGTWFVAPEYRIGWELHWRVGAQIGIALK